MPTERKRAIRTASAWSADQAAMEALYGVGGYYTSLSLWEAGEQANLTTLDEIRTAVCYNDWPSGLDDNVTVAGWTTDATRYAKITVADGHRHDGTPGTGFWITRTGTQQVVRSGQAGTVVEWVDAFTNATSFTDARAFYFTNTGVIRNCIARSAHTANALNHCLDTVSNAVRVECCLVVGGYNGIRTVGPLLNSVATGAVVGVTRSQGLVVKNTVAYGNTTNWGSGTYDAASSNNATGSATDDTPNANAGITGVTAADFANAAANDFHLSSGSVLHGAGVNLYSDFTTDIDGDTWPSSGAWDIGYDYYVEAGGPITITGITASLVTSSSARITLGVTR